MKVWHLAKLTPKDIHTSPVCIAILIVLKLCFGSISLFLIFKDLYYLQGKMYMVCNL